VETKQKTMTHTQTPQEFTIEKACEYARARKRNTRFFYNVYGWQTYFTLKPTFATPTGKAKGFPRSVIIKGK
jgi:hypothetical protein